MTIAPWNVRFWHKADMAIAVSDVRFSGGKADINGRQSKVRF